MPAPLITFCILIAAASWLGGWLPNLVKLKHRETQMVLSLVSGVMLGVALLHLLPHSMRLLESPQTAMQATVAGLLFMFFMIRMFPFHSHDSPDEDHDCDHDHHEHEIRRRDISWIGLAFGFAVHTVLDGITLASAFENSTDQKGWLLGLGVFLAILLHKPLDAWTISSLMQARNWEKKQRNSVNILFALMCPLGAILYSFGVNSFTESRDFIFGITLAFSAGVFLCISLSDLLPEVQFHSHDRLAMSGMLLLGVGIAFGLALLG